MFVSYIDGMNVKWQSIFLIWIHINNKIEILKREKEELE
jgi:hypothetical protein